MRARIVRSVTIVVWLHNYIIGLDGYFSARAGSRLAVRGSRHLLIFDATSTDKAKVLLYVGLLLLGGLEKKHGNLLGGLG